MKRDTTQTIWRTVVFAGAMLGAPACTKPKPAPTTPPTNAQKPEPTETAKPTPPPTQTADPCAGQEPQEQRPRGVDVDRPIGRGFVLS
jgi:hypothetical protein